MRVLSAAVKEDQFRIARAPAQVRQPFTRTGLDDTASQRRETVDGKVPFRRVLVEQRELVIVVERVNVIGFQNLSLPILWCLGTRTLVMTRGVLSEGRDRVPRSCCA